MWPDQVSNPGPLALESDALRTALRTPALHCMNFNFPICNLIYVDPTDANDIIALFS